MTALMREFGEFCQYFYEGKGPKIILKHYLHFKRNAEKLADFHQRLADWKTSFNNLLTGQVLLISSTNTTTLRGVDEKLKNLYPVFAKIQDEQEAIATAFIDHNGGEGRVLENDALIGELAKKLDVQLTPSLLRAVKESAEESFKQIHERFELKYAFAIQKFENRVELSTELILKEVAYSVRPKLHNGPYELIKDEDMKTVWQAIVSHFNTIWKEYRVANNVNRDDYWTSTIITKTHCMKDLSPFWHIEANLAVQISRVLRRTLMGPCIDASGYISIEELSECAGRKALAVTHVPLSWAYGWDSDNIYYQRRINKLCKKLENLCQNDVSKKEKIEMYLDGTKDGIMTIANSLTELDELDTNVSTQMKKLQDKRRTDIKTIIQSSLETMEFQVQSESDMATICKSDRIEATLLPLLSILLSRHYYLMKQVDIEDEDIEAARSTMLSILGDINAQIQFYVNGLFSDYFKKHYEEPDTESEEDIDSESEDEWNGRQGVQNQRPMYQSGETQLQDSEDPEQQYRMSTQIQRAQDDVDDTPDRLYAAGSVDDTDSERVDGNEDEGKGEGQRGGEDWGQREHEDREQESEQGNDGYSLSNGSSVSLSNENGNWD
ncbi:hypothetical protein GYMLUDRAFT_988437 [Collybiopsis luxurians FD-317 M1]|uniref:Unplaced genomic scaffold GYMLUscaffold_16, whole genome shotgun sequence n=1 Tax=Collybiopsis luxurians FD-317 M1 TaxID=944289 RepID=A0A0D0C607_9AGAR|nr:hypothetical protein GYMLUDRAFT_988437 [Collybiopsis luxurians FD-317 M1]